MQPLYLIKFTPIFKQTIWGGNVMREYLQKNVPFDTCGESWEISDVDDSVSIVNNGALVGTSLHELLKQYGVMLVGKQNYARNSDRFPILVKFIDAQEDLSVQVHPTDGVAQKKHNTSGKHEMWYVMRASEEAQLVLGFNKSVNRELVSQALNDGTIETILNKITVKEGDAFYVPAGIVHAICKGILLAEIQQTSDITYRLYDYNRADVFGKKRVLHIEDALNALNYDALKNPSTVDRQVVTNNRTLRTPYFTVNKLVCDGTCHRDYSPIDSFIIYVCVEGSCVVRCDRNEVSLSIGETLLIPACIKNIIIEPRQNALILEVYIENGN